MASPEHAHAVLTARMSRALQNTINQRDQYVRGVEELAVRDGEVQGFARVEPGESILHLTFPIVFLERPVFTCGMELPGNEPLTYGAFPIWSASVASWSTRDMGGKATYVGAELGIVAIAPENPTLELHYRFSGQSFTNPTGNDLSVGGTL